MKTFYLAFLLLLAATLTQAQQTYYVSTTGQDDAGRDGLSLATAWKSIAYAFQQVPAGNNTIQLGAGTFVLSQAASLRDGWTLNGQGHTGSTTTTITNASTFSADGAICLPLEQERDDYPLENYLIGGNGLDDVTISNLVFTSRLDQPLDGAIMMKYVKNLELFNLTVREFPWNGIYLREGKQVRVHHSFFENASYEERCKTYGGAIRTRYMNAFTLDHCEFELTKGWGYGYKGSGHENAKVHDNVFHGKTTLGPDEAYRPFDFESAHEFEWGLEIYNNIFNGMVSVPKPDEHGLRPHGNNKPTYPYSIRIHHNTFYGSAGVEGPRSHLEIDHNYFAQKWNNNGRVYEIHGADTDRVGPTSIHHNVAECSMGFVFKKNQNSPDMSIYNNTVYLVNSTRNQFPTTFLEVSGPVSNWQVKNNVVFTLDNPNSGTAFSRGSLPSAGMSLSNNVSWNVPGTPAGVTTTDPELAVSGQKPAAYYAPSGAGSYVVDRGTDVGFPFEGSAPDIGAHEWNPSTPPTPTAQHTITTSAGSNGSISPTGSVSVDHGKDKTFTITPDAGYQINKLLVDANPVSNTNFYTFTNVTANHTISASFVATPPGNVAVASVSVSATPSSITTDGGTAQLSAEVLPANATDKSLTWSVQGAALGATVSQTGLLTASGESTGNGTLIVRATSQSDPTKFGEHTITITNQASDPTPDTEAPSAVVLTAGPPTPFSVKLNWSAATDNIAVSTYHLYQDNAFIASLSSAELSYTAVDLAAESTYIFTVRAIDAAGNTSEDSNPVTITTLPPASDTESPTTVTLSLDSQTTSTASLSWTASSDNEQLAFYYLFQDDTQIATIPAATTTYTVEDLPPSTYTFTLKAVDAAGNQSEASNPVSVTLTAAPPEEPTSPTDSTDTQAPEPFELLATATPASVSLSWSTPQDDYGIVGYIILVNGVAQDTLSATDTSYSATELTADSTYTFTVVAFDQAGNTAEASYTINLAQVIDPNQPTNPLPGEPETPLVVAPPLFTPNDDGQNDTWQITLAEGQVLSSLKVYDQRGRVVFTTADANQPWNGAFQNKSLPQGAYYYVLTTLDTNNNQIHSTTGSVAIIR